MSSTILAVPAGVGLRFQLRIAKSRRGLDGAPAPQRAQLTQQAFGFVRAISTRFEPQNGQGFSGLSAMVTAFLGVDLEVSPL